MELASRIFYFALCFCALSVTNTAFAQVKLPRLVSDGMVLQRDTNVRIWGWASPGENIKVDFIAKSYNSKADKNGKWEVMLSSMKAGGPYTMRIEGEKNNITLKDILVGDVWVCSGQSNMDITMARVKDRYSDVIATSENPYIRRFLVPMVYNFKTPQQDLQSGKWESVNPESVLNFTATGYFFAKALYEKYKVPIGLIHASVGGSPAESWLSEGALKEFPEHMQTVQKLKEDNYIKSVIDNEQSATNSWYRNVYGRDEGWSKGEKWFDVNYEASDWPSMELPTYFADEELGRINGVVWFRKEIDVPASMTGKPARIELGAIIDSDHVYINGKLVGTTSYRYPPRKYDVPSDVLKEGKNIIVVRVISNAGDGGFVKGKPYELTAGGRRIDLKGKWQYKVGSVVAVPVPGTTFFQYKPLGLYNGMIAPLLDYTIKGVIWYQGESNTGRTLEYQKLFPALIVDWRSKWEQGDFPFLYVQLHNFMQAQEQPFESGWAELREAQLKTLSVPNTGMAVAIDIGEANDLHPSNKQDVGERLALAAMKVAYGDKRVVYSGPIYRSMKIARLDATESQREGNKIIISFTNTGGGLIAKGGELKQFAIAGADKKFVWANAKIEGDKVAVWNDAISKPVAVRYAWADNPEGANLYNREGLPASPFRTDIKTDAQSSDFPPQNVTDYQDRNQMLTQLGISFPKLSPKQEDPNAPKGAYPQDKEKPEGNWTDEEKHFVARSNFGLWSNYDDTPAGFLPGKESWRVGLYTPIDLLKMKNGMIIKTPDEWWNKRRVEILKDLQEELWGVVPPGDILPKVTWSVTASTGEDKGFAYKEKMITGIVDTSRYPEVRDIPKISAVLRIPADAKEPVPVMVVISTYSWGEKWNPMDVYWEVFASRGWGVCIFDSDKLQPDNGAFLTSFIIGLCNKGNWRKPTDWGSLAAWGWGVSKLIDYFQTDPDVDATKIAVTGNSRYGKAALVAMAYEPRLAIAFPSCSGSLGAKMNRRHWAQDLEHSSWDKEYHWVAGNFFKWMGPLEEGKYLPRKIELCPVDAHSLLSLCAPRPVFINGGTFDSWPDPYGMYLTCVGATPVYELLGKKGLVMPDEKPKVDVGYISGDIAYRYHDGGHTDAPDWPAFFEFAGKYIKIKD